MKRIILDCRGRVINCVPGVYAIRSADGIDCYVGATEDLRRRFKGHVSCSQSGKGGTRPLREFFAKHHQFEFEVLEECAPELLFHRERYYVALLNPTVNVNLKKPNKFTSGFLTIKHKAQLERAG